MPKSNVNQSWIESGYLLFAQDGLYGLQVERLARIMNLNKSGFYHYFGNHDAFLEELMKHHVWVAGSMADDMSKIKQFDPEFIHVLLKYTTTVMVHMQLVCNRQHDLCKVYYTKVNDLVDAASLPSWAEFIGIPHNQELARRYFDQARDMFYTRITPDRMNEEYLKDLIYDVRELVQELTQEKHLNRGTVWISSGRDSTHPQENYRSY
jgi:AcrR family transcriptional regulator